MVSCNPLITVPNIYFRYFVKLHNPCYHCIELFVRIYFRHLIRLDAQCYFGGRSWDYHRGPCRKNFYELENDQVSKVFEIHIPSYRASIHKDRYLEHPFMQALQFASPSAHTSTHLFMHVVMGSVS